MNKAEVAKLLTLVSTYDNRTVGVETVEAWHLLLQDVEVSVAIDATLRHFESSREYFMPVHVLDGAKAARGPKALGSDSSGYCKVHWYPLVDCPKCENLE